MRKVFKSLCLILYVLHSSFSTIGQTAKVIKPDAIHKAWHETEFYLFFHFGPNTYTDLEWGDGTETETLFNPKKLDCDEWCQIAKAAGAKGVIITAKHHDGFCLWPSSYSTHTVRESKWRDGKGDVIKELSAACKKHGLKFGVYLSPWDRNHPKYGTPEYNDVYASTLTELLTGYGELFEVWWDGANGEGPNGKSQVYDFPRFEKLVKQYQPNAVIFSDIGPGCRWAGNEQGTINETNWAMLDTAGFGRGVSGPPANILQAGQENGSAWIPAECDVSIRPGWFYHKAENELVKSPEQLFEIYLNSVGRGANLILNVPPNPDGRIDQNDSTNLVKFGEMIAQAFDGNLALNKRSYCVGQFRPIPIRGLTDGNTESSYRLLREIDGSFPSIEIDFGSLFNINCIKLCEQVFRSGQQVKSFKIDVWVGNEWKEVARSTTIGVRKILRFPSSVASKIRVTILEARGGVELSEIEVYDARVGDPR